MAKFYVKSGNCRQILNANNPLDAAKKSVLVWKREKRKMGTSVRISQVGFEGDHPHHAKDEMIPTTFVKKKLDK